ncbi:hypothetical protein [Altericista sp. CCNU0014]|uniref:hypothetical protein n=1 Tax=Altericista sp. CCNU0014 TaxID=3082949 RepID=UPI00384F5313
MSLTVSCGEAIAGYCTTQPKQGFRIPQIGRRSHISSEELNVQCGLRAIALLAQKATNIDRSLECLFFG